MDKFLLALSRYEPSISERKLVAEALTYAIITGTRYVPPTHDLDQ